MKTTVLGGVLFLAPLGLLAMILTKVYELAVLVSAPFAKIIPIERIAGVALLNVLAILVILGVCFLAGLAAKRAFLSKRLERLDGIMIDLVPPYAIFKAVVGSVSADEALSRIMTPVLVRFDDYEQIAFEIEKRDDKSVVFLPGAPSAWSGSTVLVGRDRIHYLDIPTYQAVRLMRVFGRGTLDLKPAGSEAGTSAG